MKYTEIQKRLIQINNDLERIVEQQNINPKAFNDPIIQIKLNAILDEMEAFINHVKPTLDFVEKVELLVLSHE